MDKDVKANENPAVANLRAHQRQIDFDGCEVAVSRQALDETLALHTEVVDALQTIIDWADIALKNPGEFNSHGVRNLDGPAFDTAREVLAKATGES